MALNTGGFGLNVMPVSPNGVQNLGSYLKPEEIFNAMQQGASLAQQNVMNPMKARAARTDLIKQQNELEQQKAQLEQTKAQTGQTLAGTAQTQAATQGIGLNNILSEKTLDSKVKLTQAQSDLADLNAKIQQATAPEQVTALKAEYGQKVIAHDAAQKEYDANLANDTYNAKAASQAATAGAATAQAGNQKSLAGIASGMIESGDLSQINRDESGQVTGITTIGANGGLQTTALPTQYLMQTEPRQIGPDDKGNIQWQNYQGGKPIGKMYTLPPGTAPAGANTTVTQEAPAKAPAYLSDIRPIAAASNQLAQRAQIAQNMKDWAAVEKENGKQAESYDAMATNLAHLKDLNEKGYDTGLGAMVGAKAGQMFNTDWTREFSAAAGKLATDNLKSNFGARATGGEFNFLLTTKPSPTNSKDANAVIINQTQAALERMNDYRTFLGDVRTELGNNVPPAAAEVEWNKYVKANPKLDKDGKLIPNVPSFKEWKEGKTAEAQETKSAQPSQEGNQSKQEVNISSKAEFDSLPAGAGFIFNGRHGIKK